MIPNLSLEEVIWDFGELVSMERSGTRLQWVRGKEINGVVVNNPFKSFRSEEEKGDLFEKVDLFPGGIHTQCSAYPFPVFAVWNTWTFKKYSYSVYQGIFFFPSVFNSLPLRHPRHPPKEPHMHCSLWISVSNLWLNIHSAIELHLCFVWSVFVCFWYWFISAKLKLNLILNPWKFSRDIKWMIVL